MKEEAIAELRARAEEMIPPGDEAFRARLYSYEPMTDADFHCPRCWMADGMLSTLSSALGGAETVDVFICSRCGNRYELQG